MSSTLLNRRRFLTALTVTSGALLAGCAPKVVEKVVKETVVIKETVEVEKVVKEAVQVEKEVTRVVEKIVEQAPAPKPNVEIRVQRQGDPSWQEPVTKVFQEQNPNITIKWEGTPGNEYWTKLRTLYAGGRLGDAFWTWHENGDYYQYYASGMVKSCQEFVDAEKFDLSVFFESALKLFYVEGKLWWIPDYAHPGPTGVYLNKKICDEVGLTYVPDTNAREADIYDDWTHEELLEVAKKLTTKDAAGKVVRYGYAGYTAFHQQVSMMRSFGGDALDLDGKTVLADSPESIAGIQWVADMINIHQVHPVPDAMEADIRNVFVGGEKLASFWHGAASATQLKALLKDRFEYVGVLSPRHSTLNIRGLLLSTGGNCISSQAENPDAAWEFLKFWGSKFVGVQKTVLGGTGPGGRPDVWYDPAIQGYHRVMPKFAELIPIATPHRLPWNNRASEYQDAINQNIQKVFLGKVDAKQGCQDAAEAARKVLAKDPA